MRKKDRRESRSIVVAIGTAVPGYRYKQQSIAEFMVNYFHIPEADSRKLSVIYQKSGIEYRHSVLPDFSQNGHLPLLFESSSANPSLSKRMEVYEPNASALAAEAVKSCFDELNKASRKKLLPVTHLVTVSCTGMSAPGLDIHLMKQLKLPAEVVRTSVNFMGCYAGFHALKMADAICRSDENASVLVVMVELCSLHFQPELDGENMVVNSLFADGAAALLVSSENRVRKTEQAALRVHGFHSKVIHSGETMMTWYPSESGFLMGLDALVPQLIEENAGDLIKAALEKYDLKKSKINYWALHPGGRKILESAQRSIGLTKDDLKESYKVLQNFGNMSSPTISFVLKSMMKSRVTWKRKEKILAAGFGPGITIETALLQPFIA